ncbi:MAG: type II toxin-antitoxin system RelE/ParE family toxin [Acidobacteriaceae bacterium]
MEFKVEITKTALADAEGYFCFVRDESHDLLAAERWWNGLVDRILSLESLPRRCPVIPEQNFFADEVRHLVYASHRIIFRIDDNTVTVLRIYHGARRPLKAGDQ